MKDEVIGITRDRSDFWFTCVDSDVIGDEELSITAKYIFSVLCMLAGFGHRSCSPSNETLATAARVSASTVKRAIKELEARGAIIREPGFSPDGQQISCITHLIGCPSEEEAL
ncbi:MAG: helix-turn-helix domain-containing protein [Synergistaceae bacterium]|nr:helix-turn-helix domain-containing protein [Synergistaceae bacterium]